MKNILSKVLNVLSIIILVLAVVILASTVLTKSGGIPSVGGYSFMRVLTGSMEPNIPTDSIIIIERMDGDKSDKLSKLQVGDVISFYSTRPELEGAPTTHRIVEISDVNGEATYVTKGDANVLADADSCTKDRIIGKVVWNSHAIGVIVRLLLNPLVFFPLIILPLLVMILFNLRDAIRRGKEIAKEEEEEAIRQALEEIKKRKKEEKEEE